MVFKWNTYFETGIDIIDTQHKELVDIINEAAPLLTSKEELACGRIEGLIKRLFDYAVMHFATEEGLMRSHGLLPSYIAKQHDDHENAVNQLIELRTQLETELVGETGTTLLRFLTGWLTLHILDEDQRMARQIRLIETGESPQRAYDQSAEVSRDDHARAALVVALMDLYGVVDERNKTLHALNEKRKEMGRQLEEANRQLEMRVNERTIELREALEKMTRTQNQLLQSEKMAAIGQLAAGVAHEINNPVGFVNSNLGALKKYVQQLLDVIDTYDALRAAVPENDLRRQRIEQTCEEVDLNYLKKDIVDLIDESTQGLMRVKKIIQDLKDFSHSDDSEPQETDINAGLESTLNVVWSELKYKANIVKQYGDLPPVRCVAAQINQVIMNLLVNAVQSIEEQGTITLASGAGDEFVWIEVMDTGKGMSEEVKQRIFEPFYTTKPVGKGTGLGLSISWDIVVQKHGGTIEVKSEPGNGSCFRIELPLNGGHASAESPMRN
jgi:two-component system, NtrC family, sensor kinase